MAKNSRNLFSHRSEGEKPEIRVSAGPCSLPRLQERIPPGLLQLRGVVGNPRCSSACRHPTPIAVSDTATWGSPCVSVFVCLSSPYKDTSHSAVGAHPKPVSPRLNELHPRGTHFQIGSRSEGPRGCKCWRTVLNLVYPPTLLTWVIMSPQLRRTSRLSSLLKVAQLQSGKAGFEPERL